MPHDALIVFTAKTTEQILKDGGSGTWRLDRDNALLREYVICTKNANAHWHDASDGHLSAFLVGRISDIVACEAAATNGPPTEPRYVIYFSEFARVFIPKVWNKAHREPVQYTSMETYGLDPGRLKWEPIPNAAPVAPRSEKTACTCTKALSIEEARHGLALTFNVAPSAIEITIRA